MEVTHTKELYVFGAHYIWPMSHLYERRNLILNTFECKPM